MHYHISLEPLRRPSQMISCIILNKRPMPSIQLRYRNTHKSIQLEDSTSVSHLNRLLIRRFGISSEVLGITDPFGKFYDLAYVAQHPNTLHTHEFLVVTSKDAVESLSFGSRTTEYQRQQCLGVISDTGAFKGVMPRGIVVLLGGKQAEEPPRLPFRYFWMRGQQRRFEVWFNCSIRLAGEVCGEWEVIGKGIEKYLPSLILTEASHVAHKETEKIETSASQSRQEQLMEVFRYLHSEQVLSDLQFYKKKVVLLQRPHIYLTKYFTPDPISKEKLLEVVREDILQSREEVNTLAVLSKVASKEQISGRHQRQEIPILVRKGTNLIEKVASEQPISAQQADVLNLLLEMELKGLLTEHEVEAYRQEVLQGNHRLISLVACHSLENEEDEIGLARDLRTMMRQAPQEKKLIQCIK